MSDRKIGKVISVDSFRVVIQLDDNLKSLYKSGFHDIYEIARINSYVIIPVGADRIVAIVTRVKIQEESEIDRGRGSISLPKAERYLVATMIGTLEVSNNKFQYIQGVYNFPILDNPVWYVMKDDLENIFDSKSVSDEIDYKNDYFLPIGYSPAFSDFQIKINPDKFLGKHAAILGNTGSGKSCTVSTIIQSLFEFEYNSSNKLSNAHFIIFDTNGEYKRAFVNSKYKDLELVNPFVIEKDGLKVPHWFMNFEDIEFLFKPSANTQVPVLKRAIAYAKNQTAALQQETIPQYYFNRLSEILSQCLNPEKNKLHNIVYYDFDDIITFLENINSDYNFEEIIKQLKLIKANDGEPLTKNGNFINGNIKSGIIYSSGNALAIELNKLSKILGSKKADIEKNIDTPVWYSFQELINNFFEKAINEYESSSNRIRDFVGTLKLRLQSYFNDDRISIPLMLNSEQIDESLKKFLSLLFGEFCSIYDTSLSDHFNNYYKSKLETIENGISTLQNKKSQITIIDMSMVPFEVLETLTGLIGRLVLEFLSKFNNEYRGQYPTVMVLEEAQNYIPEKDKGEQTSISKKVFERIAREGRKFGLSLIVSSQRPSELSKTVLSQCNTFIIHRLQNPDDQKYIRQLVSAANEDILQQLPILPQQHAIIMGDGVRTPIQVKLREADPKPNSENPEFIKYWTEPVPGIPNYVQICDLWEKGTNPFAVTVEETVSTDKAVYTINTKTVEDCQDDDLPF